MKVMSYLNRHIHRSESTMGGFLAAGSSPVAPTLTRGSYCPVFSVMVLTGGHRANLGPPDLPPHGGTYGPQTAFYLVTKGVVLVLGVLGAVHWNRLHPVGSSVGRLDHRTAHTSQVRISSRTLSLNPWIDRRDCLDENAAMVS